MRSWVQRHSIWPFIVLAYALSWTCPALAALLVVALTEGKPGVGRLLRRMVQISPPALRFWGYTVSPVAFLALARFAAWLAGSVPPMRDFFIYSGLPPLPAPVVLVLVLLCNGYGEETGWRGFALERLQQRFGAVRVHWH